MNHSQLTRLILLLSLFCSCADRPYTADEGALVDAKNLKLPELSQEPLAPAVTMTTDYFRKSYPHLSSTAWQQKWASSQQSGLMFMRSYVNTWYDELGRISNVGPVGACFGDPHPENFGFLPFGSGAFEYTYNDVDDVGTCPVVFDALRYFTTLKLYLKDPAVEAELRRAYIHFLNGEELVDRPSQRLNPDPVMAQAKLLKKATKNGKLKLDATVLAVPKAKAEALFSALQDAESCPSCKLLDAAQVVTQSGGSAGLERYWLLLQIGNGSLQILEFKQQVEPASERGPWAQGQHRERRVIMQELWGQNWPQYYAFANMENKNFLIRSRLKADVEWDAFSTEQKKALLTEQVYLLAKLHKKALTGSGLLEEWLGRQSEFQAKRYAEALLGAKGT